MAKEDPKKLEEKKQDEAKKNLKKLVEKAKGGASFGICLGKDSGQQPFIAFSSSRGAAMLEKEAKAEIGGIKTGSGTLSVNGGKIYFHFQTEIPTGTLKAIKAHFSYAGVSQKVALVDKDNRIEDDDAPQPGGDQAARSEITQGFQKLAAGLTGLATGLQDLPSQLDLLTREMQAQLTAPTFDPLAARQVFGKLQKLDQLARSTPPVAPPRPQSPPPQSPPSQGSGTPPPRPQSDNPVLAVTNEMKQALAGIKDLAGSSTDIAKAVSLLTDGFKKAVTQQPPDVQTAKSLVQQVLDLAKSSGSGGSDEEKFDFAGSEWKRAVTEASNDLDRLKNKILGEAAGEPGIGKIETAFGKISATLKQLNDALTKVISEESKGKSGPEARQVADKAIKTADQVATILTRDPILSRIDDNPFEKTTVVATLKGSIERLRQSLAA